MLSTEHGTVIATKEIKNVNDLFCLITLVEEKLQQTSVLTLLLLEKVIDTENVDYNIDKNENLDEVKSEDAEERKNDIGDNDELEPLSSGDDDDEATSALKFKPAETENIKKTVLLRAKKRKKDPSEDDLDDCDDSYKKQKKAKEPSMCVECGKVLSSKQSLSIHKMVVHQKRTITRHCPFCDQDITTTHYSTFFIHKQKCEVAHTGKVDKYECPKCGEKCATLKLFDKHKHKCYNIKWKQSQNKQNQTKYSCTFEGCDYTGAKKEFLDNHINKIHLNVPIIRNYSCEVCGKAFTCKITLKNHMLRRHTTEKPFQCSDCGSSFACEQHLTTHARKAHSDVRAFVCPYCGKGYKQRSGLIKHESRLCPHKNNMA